MNNLNLPHPKQIDIAIPANLRCGRPEKDYVMTEQDWAPLTCTFAGVWEIHPAWVEENAASLQIVDVRDDDFVGGSIPGTLNIPSRRFGTRVDSLVDELKNNEAVVFTCALSQQRGPNVCLPSVLLRLGCAEVFEQDQCEGD